MHMSMSLFTAVLFILLTLGILVSLPPGGSKVTVAMFHAVVFALVYHYTHKMAWAYLYPDGFTGKRK